MKHCYLMSLLWGALGTYALFTKEDCAFDVMNLAALWLIIAEIRSFKETYRR